MPRIHLRDARPAFTLVEILVATMLVSVGLLAMVAASATVVRSAGLARMHQSAAQIARATIDSLRAIPCSRVEPIARTNVHRSGIVERWRVEEAGGRRTVWLSITAAGSTRPLHAERQPLCPH